MFDSLLKFATGALEKLPGISGLISSGLAKLMKLKEDVMAKFGEGSEKLGFLGKLLDPLKEKYMELEKLAVAAAAKAGFDLDAIIGGNDVDPKAVEAIGKSEVGDKLPTYLESTEDPEAFVLASAAMSDIGPMRAVAKEAKDPQMFTEKFEPYWDKLAGKGEKFRKAFAGTGALSLATKLLSNEAMAEALGLDLKDSDQIVKFVGNNVLPKTERKLYAEVIGALIEKKPLKMEDVAKLLYEMNDNDFKDLLDKLNNKAIG